MRGRAGAIRRRSSAPWRGRKPRRAAALGLSADGGRLTRAARARAAATRSSQPYSAPHGSSIGKSRRVFNGGDDDARLHLGDEFVVEELVAQEAVIGADILGDHLEEVIHRAGDALTKEHFRPEPHHA